MKTFRTMRLKQIGNTKFKKYVVYAIGEVALIIIGILIAISINNWNENKKERELGDKGDINIQHPEPKQQRASTGLDSGNISRPWTKAPNITHQF